MSNDSKNLRMQGQKQKSNIFHNRFLPNLCSDKRDIILAQIEACERLSKYTKDGSDHILLEHEIVELKLALDLLH